MSSVHISHYTNNRLRSKENTYMKSKFGKEKGESERETFSNKNYAQGET